MAGSVEDMKAQSDSVSSAGLSSAGLSSTGLSSTGAPFDACAVREFVLVAHCLLNPCAKCAGLRNSEAAAQCVRDFFDRGIGIIQLPCIEMDMLGVSRWGHVKDQFEYPHYRKRCRELLSPVVDQVADYVAHGFSCVGVVGIDGSPTCGVRFCFRGAWGGEFLPEMRYAQRIDEATLVPEPGIMMEELRALLDEHSISVPFSSLSEDGIVGEIP